MSLGQLPPSLPERCFVCPKVETPVSDSLGFDVVQFARRLTCLLELLDATADALAATWDRRVEVVSEIGVKPTIH